MPKKKEAPKPKKKVTKQKASPKMNGDASMFKDLVVSSKNEYMEIIDQLDVTKKDYLDTGSFYLNAQQSASLFGGLEMGKIYILAGEESTGKTFMLLKMVKLFLKKNPRARAIIFETEWAFNEKDLEDRGIDSSRVKILRVRFIEDLKFQANKIIENYLKIPVGKRFPMMFGLDSTGQLSTKREVQNISDGEEKADMGLAAKALKAFYRTMTLPLGIANVPLIATSHLYVDPKNSNPRFIKQVMGGGKGPYYAASGILFYSKAKDSKKEGEKYEQIGAIITSRAQKCRGAKEGTVVRLKVNFNRGLDRYYGLIELCEEAGVGKRKDAKYLLPGQTKAYSESVIYKNPEKFFTDEVLKPLDEFCKEKFAYGKDGDESLEDSEEDIETSSGDMDLGEFFDG